MSNRQEMLGLAKKSLEEDKGDHREISSLTASLAPAKFEEMKKMVQEFETKLALQMKKAQTETDNLKEEEVYQFNFQLFSLTQPVTANGKSKGEKND